MLASPKPLEMQIRYLNLLYVVNKIHQTPQNETFSASRIFPEQRRDFKETVLTAQYYRHTQ